MLPAPTLELSAGESSAGTLGFFEEPRGLHPEQLKVRRSGDTAVTMCQPLFFLLSPSTSLGPLPSPTEYVSMAPDLLFTSLEPSHIQVVQPDPRHSLLKPQPLRRKVKDLKYLDTVLHPQLHPPPSSQKGKYGISQKKRSNRK